MGRVVHWFQHQETRLFCFVNQRIHHSALDYLFSIITHAGGAAVTITTSLCFALFAQNVWQAAGIQALLSLAVSHAPVAFMKKKYPRLRPYLVVPQTLMRTHPLKDHSFPSGHTTAIFSIVTPFIAMMPLLGFVLIPAAILVALSRIYLGLHYPSDCLAGCLIGTTVSLSTAALWG